MFDLRSNFNRKSSNRTSNQRSRVSNYSSHCRCCSYKRAGKQCSGTRPLASFKITVTGRHCILSGRHLIVVHCQASGATRLRMAKPASSKILSSPSSRICASTIHDPGTSHATTFSAFRRLSQWRQMHGNPQCVHWCRHPKTHSQPSYPAKVLPVGNPYSS